MAKGQRERDPKREAFWRGMLEQQKQSDLGVRAFCRRQGIAESAFHAWRRTIRQRDRENQGWRIGVHAARSARKTGPAFVPVIVHADRGDQKDRSQAGNGQGFPDGQIHVELRGGRVMRMAASTPVDRLAQIIRAIEDQPPHIDRVESLKEGA